MITGRWAWRSAAALIPMVFMLGFPRETFATACTSSAVCCGRRRRIVLHYRDGRHRHRAAPAAGEQSASFPSICAPSPPSDPDVDLEAA
jgi:hypothetical protein